MIWISWEFDALKFPWREFHPCNSDIYQSLKIWVISCISSQLFLDIIHYTRWSYKELDSFTPNFRLKVTLNTRFFFDKKNKNLCRPLIHSSASANDARISRRSFGTATILDDPHIQVPIICKARPQTSKISENYK